MSTIEIQNIHEKNLFYFYDKNCFCMQRILKDGRTEVLLNIERDNKVSEKFFQNILNKIKNKYNYKHPNIYIYIYVKDKYNHDFTLKYNDISCNNLCNSSCNSSCNNLSKDNDKSLPFFDYTKEPVNVTMNQTETAWHNVENIAFIPNNKGKDWDFYELNFILQKFESAFGFFDIDSFIITLTYPKDLLFNPIDPDIVFYYCKKYIDRNSKEDFQFKFPALNTFYRDKLGRSMLYFFYDETIKSDTYDLKRIIKSIHKIYHETSDLHPFKRYIFYENYSALQSKRRFCVKRYMLVFLSFYNMFVDIHLIRQRKSNILIGLKHDKNFMFSQYFENFSDIEKQLLSIHSEFQNDCLVWVSRNHIKQVKNKFPLFLFLYNNWYKNIRRNINLWDVKVTLYNDSQTTFGSAILSLFSSVWCNRFHLKDYDFAITHTGNTSRDRSKKKKI